MQILQGTDVIENISMCIWKLKKSVYLPTFIESFVVPKAESNLQLFHKLAMSLLSVELCIFKKAFSRELIAIVFIICHSE